MISRILLLIILNSCLCAATFRVNVAQSCYQAEENHSITLEWTFTTTPHGSSRELFIDCSLLVPPRELILYQVHEGVEVPESQDEEFSGRVQTDKDVLREGRIRLHVSRLRTEDSGLYLCEVTTEDGSGSGRCHLNVSGELMLHQPILKHTDDGKIWKCKNFHLCGKSPSLISEHKSSSLSVQQLLMSPQLRDRLWIQNQKVEEGWASMFLWD